MKLDNCLCVYFEDTVLPKRNATKKQRDKLRRVAFGTNFVILPLENQMKVDYQMPLRCMDYDVREYEKQSREIKRKIESAMTGREEEKGEKKQKNGYNEAEYLSRFGREDKLHPCATIVLYFGENWDGSKSLHEMIDFTEIPGEIKCLVQDYKINLIPVYQIRYPERYRSDLREIFALLQTIRDKKKMKELIETEERFHHMAEDAVDLIAELIQIPQLAENKEAFTKGEKVDMCKAFYDMMQDSREEGVVYGLQKGARQIICMGMEFHLTEEDILSRLQNSLEIPRQTAEEYLKNYRCAR